MTSKPERNPDIVDELRGTPLDDALDPFIPEVLEKYKDGINKVFENRRQKGS